MAQDVPLTDVESTLMELLGSQKENEEIFDYVTDCVPPAKTSAGPFVRGLMAAVCNSVIETGREGKHYFCGFIRTAIY